LEKSLPIIHEPNLDAYVTRLGASLAEHSDQGFAYRFRFYDDRQSPSMPPSPAMIVSDGCVATRGRAIAYYIPAENQGTAAMPLGFLTFTRQFELQADQVAVGTIAEVGYDPAAMVRYLEQRRPNDGRKLSQVFSLHPAVKKRLDTVNGAIGELPARTYSAGTGEFDAMKAMAEGIR